MIGATLIGIIVLGVLQFFTSAWWWVIVVPLFAGALCRGSMTKATLLGSFISGSLWTLIALRQFLGSADIVAEKIATMIGIGQPILLVVITGVLGFLLGAISANTGNAIKRYVFPVRQY